MPDQIQHGESRQQRPRRAARRATGSAAVTARRLVSWYGITAGELGASAAQTLVVALLPVLLEPYAPSATWIGFAVGGEGIFALLVPYWIGAASDHLPARLVRRVGRRSLFLFVATPVMAGAIAVMPFLHGYWVLAGAAFVFFAGLHAYFTPLWSMMVDAVPDDHRGRVQGARGVLRALGLGYGLVAAGLLHGIWKPLPFIVSAGLMVLTTLTTWWFGREGDRRAGAGDRPRISETWHRIRHNKPALWFLGANACWDGAIDGIRPYAFLFATAVLGLSVAKTSLGLMVLVAGLGIGSFALGHLSDRYGRARLLSAGIGVTALAFVLGFFTRDISMAIVVMVLAGVGAAVLLALPYPLYAHLVGDAEIGQHTGLFVVSASFGRVLAPLLVGASIDLGSNVLPQTKGYPFMWLAAAALAGTGWLALRRIVALERDDRAASQLLENERS